ncbi:nitrogen regulation protein NR(II) [Methylomagnum ishizawai]|uniref:Sensory histidine kinase/phosphatase NtrB n=1 Tax=Methylomagnum ishizawai TaxID=1760988 RepID=A0A1Y6D9R5_9GAMM|nr:nitrogen regulation protein NR(II) [Methylomagnum ishizawai]BBL76185.1 PAS domain-containing sensor histidine kinase [Methylomagnum ishizawai]SMF96465.1 two-component system, NtrC family, nitrogen regulation sensor histidine kinase GlnL [Methylomagnum ishizawai]
MNHEDTPNLHHRILDHLTDAVLLFDPEYRLVYINMAGEMLFAVSARQVLGVRAEEIFFLYDKDIEKDLQRTLEHAETLTKRNLALELPSQPITVNLTLTPMMEQDRRVAALVQIEQVDRHLRISMEEQLLAQQNAARMLLRGLAHEIKNPLGGLRGAAQLLDRELPDAELREYTKIIMEESDRLQSLVDRMLAPNKPPHKAPLNIHRVLERVRQLVQVEAPPGVVIERDYDPSLPTVNGDSDQLIQAILNVVRNAAQAVGQQGRILIRTRIHRQVTIGHRKSRHALKVEVIDDGPGIKPELLGQIFYPMVTGRADGTGLGLSIAQSLINQHGGLVECSSAPGHTVFSIFLPLEKEHE